MIVTINSDASFSNNYKIGAYAFWIVSNRFKILKSGKLKGKISHSRNAEYFSVLNALFILSKEDLRDVKKVIVNTDCMDVVNSINQVGNNQSFKGYYNDFRKIIKGFPKIEARHVKAHTLKDEPRSYVNEWCDKESKKWINKMIKEINPNDEFNNNYKL